jgi:hypothetical protein
LGFDKGSWSPSFRWRFFSCRGLAIALSDFVGIGVAAEGRARCEPYGPHERVTSCWYRRPGQPRAEGSGLEIIEAEIRSAQHEVLLEAARIILSVEPPIEAARALRAKPERIIRPE